MTRVIVYQNNNRYSRTYQHTKSSYLALMILLITIKCTKKTIP